MPIQGAGRAQPTINATTQLHTGATVLRKVVVQATGAGLTDFYDNTTTTGTPVFSLPASPAVGSVYNLDIPCALGLRVVSAASGPQLTVLFG